MADAASWEVAVGFGGVAATVGIKVLWLVSDSCSRARLGALTAEYVRLRAWLRALESL